MKREIKIACLTCTIWSHKHIEVEVKYRTYKTPVTLEPTEMNLVCKITARTPIDRQSEEYVLSITNDWVL